MKKILLFLFSLFLVMALHGQRNTILWFPGNEEMTTFQLDYPEFTSQYHKNARISTYLANDSAYLYLVLKTDHPVIQRKLLRLGLQIDLQLDRNSEQTARIEFPGFQPAATRSSSQVPPNPDLNLLKQSYILRTVHFTAEGFLKTNGRLTLNRPGDISASILADSLQMVYEIMIPLSELFVEENLISGIGRREISVASTLDPIDRRPPRQGSDQYDYPPDRGRGLTPPGGMYRPGGMQAQPQSRPMPAMMEDTDLLFRTQKIRHKFRLSSGK